MQQKPRVFNIWWTVPQDIVINASQAHAVLERHGFDKDDMPAPSAKLAVSRTAHSFQDRRHKSNRRVTEKTAENGRYVTYGILGQTRVNDEEVAFKQDTTIRFDKQSEMLSIEGPMATDFQTRHVSYRNGILSEDISAFLRRMVKMSMGIAKRPTGGIYFIPSSYSWVIENAQKVLDDLNTGAKLYLEGVMDGERERANLWGSVTHEIETRISDTLRSVERIEKRVSSIKSHEAKLSELEKLKDAYVDLLGEEAQHETLTEMLTDAVSSIGSKLNKLQGEAANRGFSSKVLDAAIEVLRTEGRAMHFSEIAKKAIANGLSSNEASVNSALAKGAQHNMVKRIKRGTYIAA